MGRIMVQTAHQGVIEVADSQVLTFIQPLLGFETQKRFVIYQNQSGPLFWLQSIEDPQACFCVLAPFAAGLNPPYEIGPDLAAALGAATATDIDVYTLVVLDRDPTQVRTNLRAPILVGRLTNNAVQTVFSDRKLPVQHFFLRNIPAGAAH